MELSRDPILVWGFDGAIEVWNRGCEELYGYSREEFLSMTLKSIRPEEDVSVLFHDLAAISGRSNEGIVRRHRNVRTLLAEVTAIDLEAKSVTLAEGDQLQYDYLILAAGGRRFPRAEMHSP